eukprot:COSAG02_NODE_33_length_50286_cov_83.550760_22_plen_97_part_00
MLAFFGGAAFELEATGLLVVSVEETLFTRGATFGGASSSNKLRSRRASFSDCFDFAAPFDFVGPFEAESITSSSVIAPFWLISSFEKMFNIAFVSS